MEKPELNLKMLEEMIQIGDRRGVEALLETLTAPQTARSISRLDEPLRIALLRLLSSDDAADLIEELPGFQAATLIEEMEPRNAASIVEKMESADRADVLGVLKEDEANAILDEMAPEQAASARHLMAYPPDTAGGLMITEYMAFGEKSTVGDVVAKLRAQSERFADYQVQYVYVVSARGVLKGVLRLRDILLAKGAAPVESVMIRSPLSVPVTADLDDLRHVFQQYGFVAIPVVDGEKKLLGVIRRAAVEAAAGEEAQQSFLKISGIVGGEEVRTLPLFQRSSRRLSWLSVNIILNVISASVIALYQETLAAVIALAVFLPIISDMSGCSGNQAVAVSIRELTLGLVTPRELFRVLRKELSVGLINGVVLGLLLSVVALLWRGNPYLGLVVGGALALNTLVAASLGGLLPLMLKRVGMDSAIASGPILTTVTDMCGFFLVLRFATYLLPYLT